MAFWQLNVRIPTYIAWNCDIRLFCNSNYPNPYKQTEIRNFSVSRQTSTRYQNLNLSFAIKCKDFNAHACYINSNTRLICNSDCPNPYRKSETKNFAVSRQVPKLELAFWQLYAGTLTPKIIRKIVTSDYFVTQIVQVLTEKQTPKTFQCPKKTPKLPLVFQQLNARTLMSAYFA